ncbi:MAG: DUF4417 domain-containing protein [Firmicutes bacterium]|nr:DUF4417 domain-containing protein [Bacillota bacterium]
MRQQDDLMSQDFLVQKKSNDHEKTLKKQRIVRNEFETVGKYDIPLVRKQSIDLDKIEPWCFTKTKLDDTENQHKTIHFFTYDWLYETVYSKPEVALEKLDQYYALMTPDFSCYFGMPKALQIHSIFRNRWCGAFWQKQGFRVIPTIEWSDPSSFEFAFDGVEQGAVVAVSTYGREDYEREFLLGYDKMLEVIKPSAVICYGEPFAKMSGNVRAFSPFNQKELIDQLGLDEYMRRYSEGKLYPSY